MAVNVSSSSQKQPTSHGRVTAAEATQDRKVLAAEMQVDGAHDDLCASSGGKPLSEYQQTVRETRGNSSSDRQNDLLVCDMELLQVDGSNDKPAGSTGQSSGQSTGPTKPSQPASNSQTKQGPLEQICSASEEELDYEEEEEDMDNEDAEGDTQSDVSATTEDDDEEEEEDEDELQQRLEMLEKELSLLEEGEIIEEEDEEPDEEEPEEEEPQKEDVMKPRDRRRQWRQRSPHSDDREHRRGLFPDKKSRTQDRGGGSSGREREERSPYRERRRDKGKEGTVYERHKKSDQEKIERKSAHGKIDRDSWRREKHSEQEQKGTKDLREKSNVDLRDKLNRHRGSEGRHDDPGCSHHKEDKERDCDVKKRDHDKHIEHQNQHEMDSYSARREHKDRYRMDKKSKDSSESKRRSKDDERKTRQRRESQSEKLEELRSKYYQRRGIKPPTLSGRTDRYQSEDYNRRDSARSRRQRHRYDRHDRESSDSDHDSDRHRGQQDTNQRRHSRHARVPKDSTPREHRHSEQMSKQTKDLSHGKTSQDSQKREPPEETSRQRNLDIASSDVHVESASHLVEDTVPADGSDPGTSQQGKPKSLLQKSFKFFDKKKEQSSSEIIKQRTLREVREQNVSEAESVDSELGAENQIESHQSGNKLICRRHVKQLFIRGDNVVMVALADEWQDRLCRNEG